MPTSNRVTLRGSEKKPLPNAEPTGPITPHERISVSVYLRRKAPDPVPTEPGQPHMSRAEFEQQHGADSQDCALVESFAHEHQLTVVDRHLGKRRIILTGTLANLTKAFGTQLQRCRIQDTGFVFRMRSGPLTIPAELDQAITAVVGLDNRPAAKPHFRILANPAAASGTFTPPQVAKLYNYPTGLTGNGQTVGIIELGGGYTTSDLQTYFKSLGIAEPTVTAVAVDGAANSPGSDADGEVGLDIEVVGSIAPGANIAVYFAPNTDQGFLDAITDAVHDTTRNPSAISISWGGPEDSWTSQSLTAMNNALQDAATMGVTVTVAAGDSGSSDGETDGNLHVDFPASSPYALACGGTKLVGSGTAIQSEVVWNETASNEGATGGGVSANFPLPSYQANAGVPAEPQTQYVGRGVPDVAGDADPETGYQVYFDGQSQIVGGTSAVAPLWAALVALMNQQLGKNVGFLNPSLYGFGESDFNDITSGNNDDSGLGYYTAGPGWDACTGLGSPNGAAIVQSLTGGSTTTQCLPLRGSAPNNAGCSLSKLNDPAQEVITATIVLRPPAGAGQAGQELLSGGAAAHTSMLANAADMSAVVAFAQQYGLTILDENFESRMAKVEGNAEQMDRAFGVTLCHATDTAGGHFLTYEGPIRLPGSIAHCVTAVLGLDRHPIARHHRHHVGR